MKGHIRTLVEENLKEIENQLHRTRDALRNPVDEVKLKDAIMILSLAADDIYMALRLK